MLQSYSKLFIFAIFTLSALLCLLTFNRSLADDVKKEAKNSWLVTTFPPIKEGETSESFMRKVSDMLQGRLLDAPEPISYLDQEGVVSEAAKKTFEGEVRKILAFEQKRMFSSYDLNSDGIITLKEVAEKDHIQIELVESLYKVSKAHGTQAIDEIHKVYDGMIETKAQVHPNSFFNGILLPFVALDLDGDMALSSAELETPSQANYQNMTVDILDEFNALQALPNGGKPVSIQTISDYAIKTFKHFDKNNSGEISYPEYMNSFYTRRAEHNNKRRQACKLPDLSDSPSPTYAVFLQYTQASASYKFFSQSDYTNYAEVYVEKQNTPINLILVSYAGIVWDIKGDVGSINKVFIFGRSAASEKGFHTFLEPPNRYLQRDLGSYVKVSPDDTFSAAVSGVPQEKIQFSEIAYCLNMERFSDQLTKQKIAETQRANEQTIGFVFGLKKPHLLKMQYMATHILVKSSPEILFDTQKIDVSTDVPKGLKKKYWDLFLTTVPKGHKFFDSKHTVSGSSYYINSPYYSGWGGIAQFEQEGIIEELKFDSDTRKAIFLLKKDLPFFVDFGGSNAWNLTLIMDHDHLKVPHYYDDGRGATGSYFCIFNRAGDYVYGDERHCSKSDLGILHKKPKIENSSNIVYLRMDRFMPNLSGEHDSFDINLKIDTKRCEKSYGKDYIEKCGIPAALKQKGALDFALTLEPGLDGTLQWTDDFTLTFTPAPTSAWDYANAYQISLELGPNILINGKIKGVSKFIPSAPFFEISNVQMAPGPLNPDDQIITADITSNYQIDRIDNMTVCHLPMGSLPPDSFFMNNSDCQALPTSAPMDDVSFVMKDGQGQVKLLLQKANSQMNAPTYLELSGVFIPSSSAGGYGKAIAYFEDPENKKAYSADINELISKAQGGNGQAQFELGVMYFQGDKIGRSLYRAHKWLTLAAKQDIKEAWLELAKVIRFKIPERLYHSDSNAFYWLTKAAKAGSAEAQYQLGLLHADNGSEFQDGYLSVFWIKKAADKNYIPALNELGKLYEEGFITGYKEVVIKPNYGKSLEYYTAALDQGSMEALAHVARIYYLGLDVAEDHAKAYDLAKKAILNSSRSDLVVRDNAAKIVAELLLEQENYPPEEDQVIAKVIAERVFQEFPKDFMRMWIAGSMPVALDTIRQRALTFDFPVIKALVEKQEKETPDLPELHFVKALIELTVGFAGKAEVFNVYYEKQLMLAVSLLEPLINDPVLDNDAIFVLADCYAAMGARKKMWAMFDYALYQRSFSLPELAQAFAWSLERLGDRQSVFGAGTYYELIGDREGAARVHFRTFGHADEFLKELIKKVASNPGQVRPLIEYASFVYYYNGDYEKALISAHKALKIDPDNRDARWMAGIAYIAKASQINKKDGFTDEVRKHMNAAKVLGIHKWAVMFGCGLYCKDIVALQDDYYAHIGAANDVQIKKRKKDEVQSIKDSKVKEAPL